MNEKMNRS